MKSAQSTTAGVTLIEVLVGTAIIAAILVAAVFTVNNFVSARTNLTESTVSMYLAEEGYEILRAIRNDDWNTIDGLTIGDTYYFDITLGSLGITSTPNQIDGTYTRSFVLSEVWRNSDDDIVPVGTSGASVDDELVEVVVTVTSPAGTKTISGIISNMYAI